VPRGRSAPSAAQRPTPLWRGLLPDAAGSRRIFRVAVLVSIVGFLAVLLVPTVRAYLGQEGKINSLRDQVTAQERSVAALQAEKQRWQDPAYIEQQARQRLKFVKVGEKAYTVIDAQPRSADVPVIQAASGVPDDLPWYDAVWGSVHAADVPGAPAP
jgi:cell division protein FtsB